MWEQSYKLNVFATWYVVWFPKAYIYISRPIFRSTSPTLYNIHKQLCIPCKQIGQRYFTDGRRGRVSVSNVMSCFKIPQSLEAARFVFRLVRSLWNLTGTSAAVLPTCLSNLKVLRRFKFPISQLRDLTRSYDKTSYGILKRGPACHKRLSLFNSSLKWNHMNVKAFQISTVCSTVCWR